MEVALDLVEADPLLRHRVAGPDGHRPVLERGEVDGDAVRRTDLVLAAVAAADGAGVVEVDVPPAVAQLRKNWNIDFDDAGAIGRRYRRQDEIGTPFCITVDFDTLEDQAVTVRERDSMSQERVALDQISAYFAQRFVGC